MSDISKIKINNVTYDIIDSTTRQNFSKHKECSDKIEINVMNPPSSLSACKIDGTTDDANALQAIFDYVKTLGGGHIVIPYTGNVMKISKMVELNCSNVILDIYSDIQFTATDFSSKTGWGMYALFIRGDSETVKARNITVDFHGHYLDGNGNNIPYTYSTGNLMYNTMSIFNVIGVHVKNGVIRNGLVNNFNIHGSKDFIIENCEFYGSHHDNGANCLDYYNANDQDNVANWANGIFYRCISHDNEDFGFTAMKIHGVKFIECVSYNNGTDSADAYNAGGGFSVECNNQLDLHAHVDFIGCRAYNNYAWGLYSDASYVTTDKDCIFQGTKNLTTKTDTLARWGSGIFFMGYKGMKFSGKVLDSESHGVFLLSASGENYIDAEFTDFEASGNGGRGIHGKGIDHVVIKNALISNNTLQGFELMNGTNYNVDNGTIECDNVIFKSNKLQGARATKIKDNIFRNVVFDHNCTDITYCQQLKIVRGTNTLLDHVKALCTSTENHVSNDIVLDSDCVYSYFSDVSVTKPTSNGATTKKRPLLNDEIPYITDIVYNQSTSSILFTFSDSTTKTVVIPATATQTTTLTGITATKTDTTYYTTDTIATNDITVTATYSDSTSQVVTGWTTNVSSIDMTTTGTKTLTVTYVEDGVTKTCNISITVTVASENVPQTGTWQLSSTNNKKYVILGTDDDNTGNAKFFRMLRTYNFPYTMNTEAECLSNLIGSDVDTTIFTESTDAPSLFSSAVTPLQLGTYIHNNNLGEVAQHGASSYTLWNSDNLTGDVLTSIYNTYTTGGGTKTQAELKTAIMNQLSSSDIAQGASYVSEKREALEDAFGFNITTVGVWGGVPTATIDGVELELNAIKSVGGYAWRANNYFAASNTLSFVNNTSPYNIPRLICTDFANIWDYIGQVKAGGCCEFFWHQPFNDSTDYTAWRTFFNALKTKVTNGEIAVVTRRQYANLGEYVLNPITSISISRAVISVGDTDSDSAYTVTSTYADGTTANVSSEAILDHSAVNTATAGTYTVKALYRGFTATLDVSVVGASYTTPTGLKSQSYWFILTNNTQDTMLAMNTTATFGTLGSISGAYKIYDCTNGKLNAWTSSDDGATWTQVKTNSSHYGTILLADYCASSDDLTLMESSGNFTCTL